MITDAHVRLRAATQESHQRLEDRVDILNRIQTAEGRRELVEGFSGLHGDAETAIAPWLADHPSLDFETRRRSAHLARDLVAVGGAAPPARPIALSGVAEALGLMYVLEGSILGGRIIRKQVTSRGGDMTGLSFLDPYGEAVGERWKRFLAVLGAEPDTDALVAGAVAGFGHAEARLCGTPVHG